jgi:ribosomal protein L14E/L6E/L27E
MANLLERIKAKIADLPDDELRQAVDAEEARREKQKGRQKTYNTSEEAKAKRKEYNLKRNADPAISDKRKEYHQRPEVKERMKEYRQRRYAEQKALVEEARRRGILPTKAA